MAKPNRNPNLFVRGNISEAAQATVVDGLDAGFNIDDIIGPDVSKIRAESKFSQENLNELVNLKSQGY